MHFPIFDVSREARPGRHRTRQRGQGLVFADTREYQYGDDIRNVDWNVTARLGKAYVKMFDQERGSGVLLLIDCSASLLAGPIGGRKAALMREVAVLFALAARHQGERLGALLFTDRVERMILPRRGRRHAQAVVRDLQNWHPANVGTGLAAALVTARRILRPPGLVIVFSDFLDRTYAAPMRALGAQYRVVPFCVTDPAERALPDAGLMSFCDPETGASRTIDSSHSAVRRAYQQKWDEIDARRRANFAELGLPALDLIVGQSYLPALRMFAGRSRR